MRRILGAAACLSSAGALLGLWFWWSERSYAADFGSELAAKLQWVGVGMLILGLAGAIGFAALGIFHEDD